MTKYNFIIALGFSLVLFAHLSSQSIGFDAIYQPASMRLLDGVSLTQVPIHGYENIPNSKPQFDLQVYRKTKKNWSYGIGLSHNTNAFYSSFKYLFTPGSSSEKEELVDAFETRHLGINLFFGKQIGRFNFTQYLGAFNNYDFSTRVPRTSNGFGYRAYLVDP